MGTKTETLLDRGELPLVELARLAHREGRRPRPVYQTHKWFARRFGSAFRAILVAAASPPGTNFWDAYERGVDLSGFRLLDPFVGGGTSLIEGQRLGANCFGADVDPVAVAVTRFQARLAGVPDLTLALNDLQAEVGRGIGTLHERERPDGTPETVVHHFWVQAVPCRHCGEEYEAHPHFQLAHDAAARTQTVLCRGCGRVEAHSLDVDRFRCGACDLVTVIGAGNVHKGEAMCPHCEGPDRLIELAGRTGSPPAFRLFACETVATAELGGRPIPLSRRLLRRAEEADHVSYARAEALLSEELAGGADLPGRLIPAEGRSDDRLIQYGYKRYTDLFNSRQKLHLLRLARAILELGGEREAMSVAFSDHLKTNCMLTAYAFGWRRLAPLFAIRAFRHVPRPVEINPWLDGTGRGTFPNAVRRISAAAAWAKAPTEYRLDGGFMPGLTPTPAAVRVEQTSAESLEFVEDGSVDLVITDPPYFDNIAYSELSDFFGPWMRRLGLITTPEIAGFPDAQLAAPARSKEAAQDFHLRLGRCFEEIARKLKPEGRVVFTYQHTTAHGWSSLAEALSTCGLRLIQAFPMLGDTDAGLHKHDRSIRWDAVLVARRGTHRGELRMGPEELDAARRTFDRWDERLRIERELAYNESDRRNFARACLIAAALAPSSESRPAGLDLLAALADVDQVLGITGPAKGSSRCRSSPSRSSPNTFERSASGS